MTPKEYSNSINIDRELKMLASYNKHTSRNNNAIYKTYCLGEFEKENDMIKSCGNCMHRGASTSSIACRGCDLNTNLTFGGSLDKWMPYSRSIKNIKPIPAIKDVIFNPPATIIIWEDKTKTVVKCGEKDIYDPEKGMAMAISRKALGDRGSYYNVFEKWLEPYYKKQLDEFVEEVLDCNGKVKKHCSDCKYSGVSIMDEPCRYCYYQNRCYARSYWTPKESDDHKEKDIDKCCDTCKYDDRTLDQEPCNSCTIPTYGDYAENWTPKESDD